MRGKQAKRKTILPDDVYGSEVVTKLINYVMQDGRKSVARKQVYAALEDLASKTKKEALVSLDTALTNAMPKLEIRSRRVGGSNYQVPMPVSPHRQMILAMRWIVASARSHKGSIEFWESLSRELLASYNNEGHAVKKKEDLHRMAEANKAFAHFAW